MALLDYLGDLEYMARAYDPDRRDWTEAERGEFKATERHVTETRGAMWRASGLPLGDAVAGDTDGYLRYESRRWSDLTKGSGGAFWTQLRKRYRNAGLTDWRAAGYGERAALLRHDLGNRFLNTNADERAAMLRRWVHRYQKQGRLSRGKPWARASR